MSKKIDRALGALLDDAERRGACLVARERWQGEALRRRSQEVVSPASGLFARRTWWEGLRPNERALALMRGLCERHPSWAFCGTSAAREGPEFLASLRERIEAARGRCRGVDHALRTLACADARAESGGESIARAVMIEQGFMLPALQAWVPDPLNPGRWFRVDFLWVRADGRVIVGELDGGAKSKDPEMTQGRSREEVLLAERRREALITAYDVSIVRFSYAEAAGVAELVRKLELYGVPRASSSLALSGEPPTLNWESLRRR